MPLEQTGNSVTFYAFFTNIGSGATGLTVTVDVWEVTKAGTATEIVSAASATEIGDGLYRYLLASGSVDAEGECLAVFKTSGTCDQAHIPALWVISRAGIEYLNTSLSSLTPAQVWNYTVRTLTQSAAQVQEIVEGSVVSVYQYTTWSISLTGLGDISSRSKLYFTVKGDLDAVDASTETILQVEETAGLIYIDGAAASDSGKATLVVDNATLGNITVTVDESVTGLDDQHGLYDVKMVTTGGLVQVLTISTFQIKSVITKAVA